MTKSQIREDAPYLDSEEQEIMEAFDAAIDQGRITPPDAAQRTALNDHWNGTLRESQRRKAITLRVQTRDLSRLKSIAQRRGIPYQTLVSSILHQFANGDMIEKR